MSITSVNPSVAVDPLQNVQTQAQTQAQAAADAEKKQAAQDALKLVEDAKQAKIQDEQRAQQQKQEQAALSGKGINLDVLA
ncbi:MAG: hypothetical protein JWP38_1126 [Herbaspirillum sp.]|jgi:hypothetical protein|nr:hypothetical protein [Herbaspirillum sp.]